MAPAVPTAEGGNSSENLEYDDLEFTPKNIDYSCRAKSMTDRPKSILKQSPLHSSAIGARDSLSKQQKFAKSRLRVSINLPDNEISLKKSGNLSFRDTEGSKILKGKAPLKSNFSTNSNSSRRTVVEVLREMNADVLALQDVKAEEEKSMKPLSDLAEALGMKYVFAESWAPEYGNAILSKWPIKRWKAQKIFDDTDFRSFFFLKFLCLYFFRKLMFPFPNLDIFVVKKG